MCPENVWMYPRSGFWYRGTSECTLVTVFGTGENPPKPRFLKPSFCETPRFKMARNMAEQQWQVLGQETLSLRFRSCFLNFGTYGLALVNQIFDSDFCLAGVPLQMTFANCECTFSNHEWTRTKLRIHSAKLQRGAWLQPEPHFKITPDYEQRFSDHDWRSSTWNSQITNGPKNPASKPKFAWAKNNHETTKLPGVQYLESPNLLKQGV